MFKLSDIKVGDNIVRLMGGMIEMPLQVTKITEDRIVCGDWEFDKETGNEIDDELCWGKYKSGSRIIGIK